MIRGVCRKYGIADNMFYIWQRRYGNMHLNEIKLMKSLEVENRKLKRLIVELSLENMVQKDVIKNF